jgi:hypothetical protein
MVTDRCGTRATCPSEQVVARPDEVLWKTGKPPVFNPFSMRHTYSFACRKAGPVPDVTAGGKNLQSGE